VKIVRRFAFSSELRRMSVIANVSGPLSTNMKGSNSHIGMGQELFVLCKGAPEAILPLLKSVPPRYTAVYLKYMSQGLRVIALACKGVNEYGK
jgi:manganese-transporting P-type ATPase